MMLLPDVTGLLKLPSILNGMYTDWTTEMATGLLVPPQFCGNAVSREHHWDVGAADSQLRMSVPLGVVLSAGALLGVPPLEPQLKALPQEMVREPWPSWVSRILMTCPSPTRLVGLAISHPEAERVSVKTLPCEALIATDPPDWVSGTTAGE